jgi:hypothetical protein
VVNRSRGGLSIEAEAPYRPGTVLLARPAAAPDDVPWVWLEVRNCRRKGQQWGLGCKFTEALPWSTVLIFG